MASTVDVDLRMNKNTAEKLVLRGMVSKENFLYFIQLMCTCFTIGLFLTGIITCRKIVRERSVLDVTFLPFLSLCLNCALWFAYGVMINDHVVCSVNSIGMVLQMIYMSVFFHYLDDVKEKHSYRNQVIAAAVIFLCSLMIISQGQNEGNKRENLGLICDFFNIIALGSPLAALGKVVRTKSTQSMSFPLSLMTLVVSMSWFSYGYLIQDPYIQVPNGIGIGLALIQLFLFYLYRTSGKSYSQP